MKLSILSFLAMAPMLAVLAAPLADQSPNLDARQVTLWVWACDSP